MIPWNFVTSLKKSTCGIFYKKPTVNKLFLAIALLFSGTTWADNRAWTADERAWGATAALVTLADWATTRDLTRRYNEGYYERNPVLGRYPSTDRVDIHFAVGGVITYLIADNLDRYRKPFLMGYTAIELIVVNNNLNIGLKMKF